ncbi:hypothetical protein IE81DRAFT_320139 [Ceraceosorus guamensis]|uniref:Uncharacterized protein n=1 Tax=Ceraceosorus guamensis TaxID=1522189 RepID=A0A316W603_9BASI|nr:hypothetical protein IE81DRAFT_320139 [Ceraceosorus guamensis]PWN45390.1 hypothetical protein IE81DRAFT_320139 [Ceraceosorus guamensis]
MATAQDRSDKVSRTIIAPYGLWESPVTSDLLTQANISFGDVVVLPRAKAESKGKVAYVENRPYESGRSAVIYRSFDLPLKTPGDGEQEGEEGEDLTQGKYSAQCGIHEYGGGAAGLGPSSTTQGKAAAPIIFTQAKSNGVFLVAPGEEPRQIREDSPTSLLGDFHAHPTLPLMLCVHEDHTVDTPEGVKNSIGCLDTRTGKLHALVEGPDFSTAPRFSPCGRFVVWVSWDQPSMPFWGTQLWAARFKYEEGKPPIVTEAFLVAGSKEQVAHMPTWGRTTEDGDAALFFTDDETGFANIYEVRLRPVGDEGLRLSDKLAILKTPEKSDFQQPAWQLNGSPFATLNASWIACTVITRAIHSLALVHLPTRTLRRLDTPFRTISQLRAVDEQTIVFVGTRFDEPAALVAMDLSLALDASQKGEVRPGWIVLKRSSDVITNGTVPRAYLSEAVPVEFPTVLPNGDKSTAHAIVFPPKNAQYVAPRGSAAPAIILAHGGPTSAADAGLSLLVQFWTTRGFLVCTVNYGGSTGYGREYMERLMGNWGVVDVRDCASCAEWLAKGAVSASGHRAQPGQSRRDRAASTKGQAQLAFLSERTQASGAKEVIFRNPDAGWKFGALDVLCLTATSALSALPFLSNSGLSPALAALAFWVYWLFKHIVEVQQETVTSIPGVGLQLTTIKGFSIPWVHHRRAKVEGSPKPETLPGSQVPTTAAAHFQAVTLRTRLIPRDSILDVVTIEAFRRWEVIDYLAIMTKAAEGSDGAGRGGQLEVIFPSLLPKLPVVEAVYEKLFDRPAPAEANGWDPASQQQGGPIHSRYATNDEAVFPPVDPSRIAIAGQSSGGYTVLAALCDYPDAFSAGRSSFGISELKQLAELSHKFELRYPTGLLGGTPAEVPEVYRSRSPLYKADRIKAPVRLFQGSLDKVVPKEQSEAIRDAILKNGGRVEYTLFEGEGHGFRRAENQKAALEGELDFYVDVFKLKDDVVTKVG